VDIAAQPRSLSPETPAQTQVAKPSISLPEPQSGIKLSPSATTYSSNINETLKLESLYDSELLLKAIDLYFLNFYPDIFFSLHEPSVRSAAKSGTIKPILAVAILALTARFIPELVENHGSPVAACDFFANTIESDLLLQAHKPSLEKIHGLLLLSLHEWGSGRGAKAVRPTSHQAKTE
jgi:hypothetical protein